MRLSLILAIAFATLSAFLFYLLIDMSVERDDLLQASKADRESVDGLLSYIAVNSACDITPDELAEQMSIGLRDRIEVFSNSDGVQEVSNLGFRAQFDNGRIKSVEIIDVKSVSIC